MALCEALGINWYQHSRYWSILKEIMGIKWLGVIYAVDNMFPAQWHPCNWFSVQRSNTCLGLNHSFIVFFFVFSSLRCRSYSPAGPVQPQRHEPLLLDDDLTPPYFFPPISLYPSPWGWGDSGPWCHDWSPCSECPSRRHGEGVFPDSEPQLQACYQCLPVQCTGRNGPAPVWFAASAQSGGSVHWWQSIRLLQLWSTGWTMALICSGSASTLRVILCPMWGATLQWGDTDQAANGGLKRLGGHRKNELQGGTVWRLSVPAGDISISTGCSTLL